MQDKYDIDLPQSLVESFARFLIPQIREYREYYNDSAGEENPDMEQETND